MQAEGALMLSIDFGRYQSMAIIPQVGEIKLLSSRKSGILRHIFLKASVSQCVHLFGCAF
jgi:hypothetical protein